MRNSLRQLNQRYARHVSQHPVTVIKYSSEGKQVTRNIENNAKWIWHFPVVPSSSPLVDACRLFTGVKAGSVQNRDVYWSLPSALFSGNETVKLEVFQFTEQVLLACLQFSPQLPRLKLNQHYSGIDFLGGEKHRWIDSFHRARTTSKKNKSFALGQVFYTKPLSHTQQSRFTYTHPKERIRRAFA